MTGRSRGSGDAGVTLVEMIVTVAIMAIALVAIVSGMGTSIIASDVHRDRADVSVTMRGAVDALVALPYDASCPAGYSASGYTPPPGVSVVVNSVEYWNGTDFSGPCPDAHAQRLTVTVAATGRSVSETVQLVKRSDS